MGDDYKPLPVPTQWTYSFLYFLAIFLGVELGNKAPATTLSLSIGLISAGLPTLIYGLTKNRQYKNVFDYEPIVFRKRVSNSKRVRTFLMACNWIGLYCLIVGIIFLFKIM